MSHDQHGAWAGPGGSGWGGSREGAGGSTPSGGSGWGAPPGGSGWGAPPGGGNPYHPPAPGYQPFHEMPVIEEGNYVLGIALGFLLGLWGLIGSLVFGKSKTKRGAIHGFLGRIAVTVVVVALAFVFT